MGRGEGPYTDAQTMGYAARDVARVQANADMAVAGIETTGSIIRELFSAAKANPLIGILAALVTVDILHKAGAIRDGTAMIVFRIVESFALVSLATEGISAFSDFVQAIDPFKSGGSSNAAATDVLTPVPTTLVESRGSGGGGDPSAGASPLAALLPKIASVVPAGAAL